MASRCFSKPTLPFTMKSIQLTTPTHALTFSPTSLPKSFRAKLTAFFLPSLLPLHCSTNSQNEPEPEPEPEPEMEPAPEPEEQWHESVSFAPPPPPNITPKPRYPIPEEQWHTSVGFPPTPPPNIVPKPHNTMVGFVLAMVIGIMGFKKMIFGLGKKKEQKAKLEKEMEKEKGIEKEKDDMEKK